MIHTPRKKYLYSIVFCLILMISTEGIMFLLEDQEIFKEPYEWGSRDDIPTKINLALELFLKNPGKKRVVVLGDSRVERALDPFQFDDYFKGKTITFNIGIEGTAVQAQAVILKAIIERCNPDFIIWDLSYSDFYADLYYYSQDNEVKSSPMGRYYNHEYNNASLNDEFESWLLFNSRLYRYRRQIIPHWLDPNPDLGQNTEFYSEGRGYIASYESTYNFTSGIMSDWYMYDLAISDLCVNDFNKSLALMQEKNISYLMVHPPHGNERHILPAVEKLFEALPSDNYITLNGDFRFSDSKYFYNYNHLNSYGAAIYTNVVCEKLNTINAWN